MDLCHPYAPAHPSPTNQAEGPCFHNLVLTGLVVVGTSSVLLLDVAALLDHAASRMRVRAQHNPLLAAQSTATAHPLVTCSLAHLGPEPKVGHADMDAAGRMSCIFSCPDVTCLGATCVQMALCFAIHACTVFSYQDATSVPLHVRECAACVDAGGS